MTEEQKDAIAYSNDQARLRSQIRKLHSEIEKNKEAINIKYPTLRTKLTNIKSNLKSAVQHLQSSKSSFEKNFILGGTPIGKNSIQSEIDKTNKLCSHIDTIISDIEPHISSLRNQNRAMRAAIEKKREQLKKLAAENNG